MESGASPYLQAQTFVPGTLPPGLVVAGSAAGRFTLAEAL